MTAGPGDSPFADRVVIVLGKARSGTTWLVQLLAAHPDFASLSWESTVFYGLIDLWESAHRSDGEGVCAYMHPDRLVGGMRSFCDRTFAVTAEGHSAERPWFIEKTPDNVSRLPLVAAVYPDAWFIHLLRDGRDVARSQVVAPWGTDDAAEAANHWVKAVRQVQRHRWRLQRFREIRYEDLVADPVGEASALWRWMGIDVGDEAAQLIAERVPEEVARYGASDRIGPGKWTQMSADELAGVYRVAGGTLAELGYLDGTHGG